MQSQVFDRIEQVVAKIRHIDEVVGVVLFGSYARGDYDEGSDVDLLVIFRDKNAMTKGSKELYKATSESDLFFQIVSLTVDELRSSPLLESAKREGKTYFMKGDVEKLFAETHRPYTLITFSTAKLSPRDRVVLAQALEGRGKGRYRYEGLIHRLDGYKVGKGVMMIPIENLRARDSSFGAEISKLCDKVRLGLGNLPDEAVTFIREFKAIAKRSNLSR